MQLDNSKQAEYLEDIKDIGMKIVFKEINEKEVYKTFVHYTDFLEETIRVEYLRTLRDIINNLENQTPDDILIKMGQYTKKIIYESVPLGESMYAEL